MKTEWFDALEKQAALDNPVSDLTVSDVCDWLMLGLFIVFLALCAADLV